MRCRLSIVFALVLVFASALTPAYPTDAAAPPTAGNEQTSAADSPFLILYPQLRQAPAPAWLRPGVRLTYNSAYATFAREIDDPTPSGAGLIQYDVIAQDRRSVVVVPTLYGIDSQGQPPTGLGYLLGLPGLGETWFAPQVLADAEAAAHDGLLVNRLTVDVEGESYDVVRFQSNTDSGEEVWEFEEQTGLLVFHRQALYDGAGNQTSANMQSLVGRRQVKLPWRFGSVPTWASRGAEIELAGSQTIDLGSPPYIPLPMAIRLRITKAGSLWSEYSRATYMNSRQIAQGSGATGVAQIFGGIWLPPQALGVLHAGEVLDRDPLTGLETSVAEATARQIVIAGQGPSYTTRYVYDARSGRLIGYSQEAHMLAGVQYTDLSAP